MTGQTVPSMGSTSRIGRKGLKGTTLYSTTFPCHNCARHIVASGIDRVIYIEPYEKSLALELHSDSIALDPDDGCENKVEFMHFEGISPRQYQKLFAYVRERKDKYGDAILSRAREGIKVTPQYIDSYQEIEDKVVEHIKAIGIDPGEIIS